MKNRTISLLLTLCVLPVIAQNLPSRQEVLNKMLLANQYFMNKWTDPTANIVTDKTRPSNLWTRGTYYEGLMQLYYITKDPALLKYAVDWGTYHKWQPTYVGTTVTRIADNQCCGQTYAELFQLDTTKTERMTTMKASIDAMVNSVKSNDWWWVDAMHMSMPLFTRMGVIYRDKKYFDKLYSLYCFPRYQVKSNTGLYNTTEHLWYRDSTFLPPAKSPNGLSIYWSRGNGWVIGALVRTLDILPSTDAHYQEYLTMFKEMMSKLISIQRTDGFWNVNLGDPNDYGGKETSGTVFFTYGLAWGINKGILDSTIYFPALVKAWNGLVNDALHIDGALGYMQSSGSKPADGQPLSYDKMPNFEDFGLGGFLLAGSEVYKLAPQLTGSGLSVTETQVIAFPNPFTNIVSVKAESPINSLLIFDASGRCISKNNPSTQFFQWNGTNDSGIPVSNGIYFIKVIMPDENKILKISRIND